MDAQDTGEGDNPLGLPAGPYEIPLVLQDKTFDATGACSIQTRASRRTTRTGCRSFRRRRGREREIWPFVDVEPRRYGLRVVNGSQPRFYNLEFAHEQSGRVLPFTQIGAEPGILRALRSR